VSICYNQNVKIKSKLAVREIAGELYMVDIAAETLHNLNGTGSFIWECFAKGLDVAGTARRLAAEYDVPVELAASDTAAFASELKKKGLLV